MWECLAASKTDARSCASQAANARPCRVYCAAGTAARAGCRRYAGHCCGAVSRDAIAAGAYTGCVPNCCGCITADASLELVAITPHSDYWIHCGRRTRRYHYAAGRCRRSASRAWRATAAGPDTNAGHLRTASATLERPWVRHVCQSDELAVSQQPTIELQSAQHRGRRQRRKRMDAAVLGIDVHHQRRRSNQPTTTQRS